MWVPDLTRARTSWGWLLTELGYTEFRRWPAGCSWAFGPTYIVLEQSPALTASEHDRCRPGLNHLAFHAGDSEQVDDLMQRAGKFGWEPLFEGDYPYAGGPENYAGFLVDRDGYEVELVADTVHNGVTSA